MQNDQQKRVVIAKRIIIVVVILVTLFAIGVGVALLLKNVSNLAKNQTNGDTTVNTGASTTSTPSAVSVINGYVEPETMRIFTAGYQLQQDTTAPSRIAYTADGKKYEVSLSTDHYALFYAKDGQAHADSPTVETQTTAYMKDKGFQIAASNKPGSLVTYVDNGSVCQLTEAPKSTPSYYVMACADKSDVDNEYASVEQLLAIYKKSHQLDAFTRAITSTITTDNRSMTTISLAMAAKHPLLLFAAVNGNWSYIGDLGGGTEASSNGKYSLTPQIQSAIRDPKYGDFLVKNIQ